MSNLQEDIVEGITLLNKYKSGWASLVNVAELDMSNFRERKDLLSQLYGDYSTGYRELHVDEEATSYCGFYIIDEELGGPTWWACTREWKSIIREIQALPEGETFEVEAVCGLIPLRKNVQNLK